MATPIRIKRSAVPGKRPTTDQLQLGELALNFYDGKIFFNQQQNNTGIGTRLVEIGAGSVSTPGKTLYVTAEGNDLNSGLNEVNAKATIKSAVAAAVPGDTVKVYPGTFLEDNPIYLPDNVSIEGLELRQCLVQPKNPEKHLFFISNGTHITDLSFVGQPSQDGAAVVAYRPLLGTQSDRFFDAARLIRQNLDFIAQETVGFITSTDYKNPAITIDSANCADDIKDVYLAVCHDITRGGNFKCIEAGKKYFDINGNLDHIVGFGTTTIDAFNHSKEIARAVINNSLWGRDSEELPVNITGATYNKNNGLLTITAPSHGLIKNEPVKLDGLEFNCGSTFNFITYSGNGTNYIISGSDRRIGITSEADPVITVWAGDTIIFDNSPLAGAHPMYIRVSDDGASVSNPAAIGEGTDTVSWTPSTPGTYYYQCSVPGHQAMIGTITVLPYTGNSAGVTTTFFPDGKYGYIFPVQNVVGVNTFTTVVGISTIDHTYVRGGTAQKMQRYQNTYRQVRDLSIQADPVSTFNNVIPSCSNVVSAIYTCVGIVTGIVQNGIDGNSATTGFTTTYPGNGGQGFSTIDPVLTASYDNLSGVLSLTLADTSYKVGDRVEIRDLVFSCHSGTGIGTTTQKFPSGAYGYEFPIERIDSNGVISIRVGVSTLEHTYESGGFIIDRSLGITTASYTESTGIVTVTAPGVNVNVGDVVELRNLEFSCDSQYIGVTTTFFPDGTNGYTFKVTDVSGDDVTMNVGISTIAHTYVSGGKIYPPYGAGVGIITKGPYIRNCTNFIPLSIGSKINGFDAEEGDVLSPIGVQGSFNIDSFTQYNQGGIGVSVTNGAYAQLVSLFTICDDIAVFTGGGGQCDLTNSNSSFGTFGLVSKGLGNQTSKTVDRYTGDIYATSEALNDTVVIEGLGQNRPYQGQVVFFDRIYYEIDTINITNPGSGYVDTPPVNIDSPTGPGIAVDATAVATVQNGQISLIDIISSGTQYVLEDNPQITIDPPPGAGVTATAEVTLRPIYYGIQASTEPVAGIATVTLNTALNNAVGVGTTVFFARQSFQIVSSHSFQYIGAGNTIESAYPSKGGVTIQENEVVKIDGGQVVYTSTDQDGNFRIGDGVVIDQAAGSVTGDVYVKSLFSQVTPFILALGGD